MAAGPKQGPPPLRFSGDRLDRAYLSGADRSRIADQTNSSDYALKVCEAHRYVRSCPMTGNELEKRIRKLGRRRGVPVSFDPAHGKGSHGRLCYGERFTTLKDRKKEIGQGC